jgi:hypothetical protein
MAPFSIRRLCVTDEIYWWLGTFECKTVCTPAFQALYFHILAQKSENVEQERLGAQVSPFNHATS